MEFTAETIDRLLGISGKRLTRSLGQNFLFDEMTLRAIVDAVGKEKQNIIEIGAGVGLLTGLLCENHNKVVTVEIDEGLRPILSESVKYSNFTLEIADILKTDLAHLSKRYFDGGRYSIVGNLPYYITTKIIDKLLLAVDSFDSAVIMVQKEFADRMFARPGTKEYRAVTVCMQAAFDIERICEVPPHCFVPAPHIDSTVLRLTPRKVKSLDSSDIPAFITFADGAFIARRKQMLSAAANLKTDRQMLSAALHKTGLSLSVRAETLTPEQFVALYHLLQGK